MNNTFFQAFGAPFRMLEIFLIFFKKGIDISKIIVYNKTRRKAIRYARVAELVDAHV